MQFKNGALAAFAVVSASAQSLTSVLTSNPDLSNLTSYVSLFPNLLSTLGNATNITLLAPSNAAFTTLLSSPQAAGLSNSSIQAILEYHVLQGTIPASAITSTPTFAKSSLTDPAFANVTGGQAVEALTLGNQTVFLSGLLQQSNVTQANLNFTGGVIHIIDSVLTVPENISTTAVTAGLTSVAGALTDAGLVETVDTLKDITVFAPTNAAFQAIGSATGNLTMSQLAGILEYHVINGTVAYSTSLTDGMSVPSLGGPSLTIKISNGTVFVNNAKVVIPNVLVANGVVHVIDQVLNPNATSATANPTASTQTVAFSGASSATDVPFTSGIVAPVSTATAVVTSAGGASASASGSATPSAGGANAPMVTGAMGMAALFGAGAMVMNI